MTITFDQYLGIAGLVAGIVGVAYGAKRDQKLKTAREAEKQIEKKFMLYMATDEFQELAIKTAGILGYKKTRMGTGAGIGLRDRPLTWSSPGSAQSSPAVT